MNFYHVAALVCIPPLFNCGSHQPPLINTMQIIRSLLCVQSDDDINNIIGLFSVGSRVLIFENALQNLPLDSALWDPVLTRCVDILNWVEIIDLVNSTHQLIWYRFLVEKGGNSSIDSYVKYLNLSILVCVSITSQLIDESRKNIFKSDFNNVRNQNITQYKSGYFMPH